ncbi:MAG: response regulator transcription factor [Saprospiraceae bacterium]|nr:response regulator transcription factor [Saprospiraceae bacterium]
MKKLVYIIDDHALFSKSLEMLINTYEEYTVGFCGQNGRDLVFRLQDVNFADPDIILLDLNMPVMNGIETMDWISKNRPSVPVLVLSMQDDEKLILEMVRKGVKGYLLKDITPIQLKKALDDTLQYGFYHTEKVTKALVGALQNDRHHVADIKEKEMLFLRLACTEKTYKEIADEMHLSPKTIDGYREALFEKLEVKSRVGLVLYAIRHNICRL